MKHHDIQTITRIYAREKGIPDILHGAFFFLFLESVAFFELNPSPLLGIVPIICFVILIFLQRQCNIWYQKHIGLVGYKQTAMERIGGWLFFIIIVLALCSKFFIHSSLDFAVIVLGFILLLEALQRLSIKYSVVYIIEGIGFLIIALIPKLDAYLNFNSNSQFAIISIFILVFLIPGLADHLYILRTLRHHDSPNKS